MPLLSCSVYRMAPLQQGNVTIFYFYFIPLFLCFFFFFFFLNLFYRDTILKLLLDGARELGHIVCSHIRALLNELHALRRRPDVAAALQSTSQAAGTFTDEADNEGVDKSKGLLMVLHYCSIILFLFLFFHLDFFF